MKRFSNLFQLVEYGPNSGNGLHNLNICKEAERERKKMLKCVGGCVANDRGGFQETVVFFLGFQSVADL